MRATEVLFRRVRHFQLTTKQGPKNYYKGTGSGRMGRHTKHGGYRIDYRLVRTYVVPLGLDKFKLTPFVTKKILPLPFVYRAGKNNIPTNAHHYLRRWKRHNEMD